jgi:hypothetical protein
MSTLEIIVIASLAIFGVDATTQFQPNDPTTEKPYGTRPPKDTEVFGFVRYHLMRCLYGTPFQALLKPLMTCTICMASVWGSIFYLLLTHKINTIEWLVVAVSVCGLNRLLILFTRM